MMRRSEKLKYLTGLRIFLHKYEGFMANRVTIRPIDTNPLINNCAIALFDTTTTNNDNNNNNNNNNNKAALAPI